MRKKLGKPNQVETGDSAWPPGNGEAARDSAVAHLEAFVSLTTKGFLLVAGIAVGVGVNPGRINILGSEVPADQAANLVSVFFIAVFVAIALHALNIYLATLSLASVEPELWINPVLTGAGVLSPLACWPGRLGLVIGGLAYGLPFGLWWAMDITAWHLHTATATSSVYPLRYVFIASGLGVGLLVGATCVRVYQLVRSPVALKRKLRAVGVVKWSGAVGCSWVGYCASLWFTGKAFESPFQGIDILVAYPLTYAIPAWGLVPPAWLLWAGGASGVAALGAVLSGQVAACYSTAGVAVAALVVGGLRRRA